MAFNTFTKGPSFSSFHADGILYSDPTTKEQYFGSLRRTALNPEMRLMLSILEDGIECFQKHLFASSRVHQNIFHDAENWIQSRDTEGLFTFEIICTFLSLDPSYLRKGLTQWKEDQLTCGKPMPRSALFRRNN